MIVVRVLNAKTGEESSSISAELNADNKKRMLDFVSSEMTAISREKEGCVITISYRKESGKWTR